MKDDFIERQIVTGLIVSTDYILRIRKVWNSKLLQSSTARRLANWCIEFFDEYNTAPGEEIKSIFRRKSKKLKEEDIEDIEDIIAGLSDEYERKDKFNVSYLFDQTIQYFDEKNLLDFIEEIKEYLDDENIVEAKKAAYAYKQPITAENNDLDLSDPAALKAIEKAFANASKPLITYPRQLGQFWNDQLVRGAFIALMAPEKRGKTWWLLDLAMRAARQRVNVAFFQAGDMTQEEQLRRLCIYLTKKSNKEKYSGIQYEPVRDCVKNQLDQCDLKARECDFGIFDDKDYEYLRKKVTYEELVKNYDENPEYKPCWNCSKYWKQKLGAVWLKKIDTGPPLTVYEAKKAHEKFFIKENRRFRISTHPNGTLSVGHADSILDLWELEDGFVADIIIFDYGDIMLSEYVGNEFRHKENDKWMRMRGMSQKRYALVINVTQTDADSYEQDRLSLKNYTEDKRRFGHVTAMFGLNQDKKGREKKIGIMRINEIVIREDAFSSTNEVYVLQNLKRGQPCLMSYW